VSVTTTVIVFVLGPCPSFGVQVNTPLVALIAMPVSGDTSEKVSGLAGMSESVALLVTVSVAQSLIFVLAGTVSTGAVFDSFHNHGEAVGYA